MDFAERLKLLREERNVSQVQLMRDLSDHHISRRAMAYYETGEQTPNLEKLIALADYFSVSLDYLAGRTDNPEVNR